MDTETSRQLHKEMVENCIRNRKENKELTPCVFYITVPDIRAGIEKNPVIEKISRMLNKYHISHRICDTVVGAYNLNRDWVETTDVMNCAVEYCGVYPVDWDIEDVLEFEEMEYSGKILVQVVWKWEDGEHELNH